MWWRRRQRWNRPIEMHHLTLMPPSLCSRDAEVSALSFGFRAARRHARPSLAIAAPSTRFAFSRFCNSLKSCKNVKTRIAKCETELQHKNIAADDALYPKPPDPEPTKAPTSHSGASSNLDGYCGSNPSCSFKDSTESRWRSTPVTQMSNIFI